MQRALVGLCLLIPALAAAQVEDLENPGTVSAIQDRVYRMQHEIDLSVGVLPLDAFTKGLYAQVGYTAHFTDTFAWQVARAGYSYSAKTGLREQLERDFGVLPTSDAFDSPQFFVGSDLVWKPFYGKLSVLNKSVVYGEMFFILGATLFRFTQSFAPGINIGGGGRVFLSKHVSLRLDVTDNILIPTGGASTKVSNVMMMTLSLGINFGATE